MQWTKPTPCSLKTGGGEQGILSDDQVGACLSLYYIPALQQEALNVLEVQVSADFPSDDALDKILLSTLGIHLRE